MKLTIKAIATYGDVEVDGDAAAPGFDLETLVREECERLAEAFMPDKVEYLSYEIVE